MQNAKCKIKCKIQNAKCKIIFCALVIKQSFRLRCHSNAIKGCKPECH